MRRFVWIGGLVLLVGAWAFLAACGGGGGGEDPASTWTYKGTQSPGDVWTYVLGGGTFSATNETLGYDYSGTVSALANGYLRLDVTDSDDPEILGDLPVAAYAIELPGVVLYVKPADPDAKLVACVSVGTNPTSETTYNYVKFPHATWGTGPGGPGEEEAWGTAASTITGAGDDVFNFWIELWRLENLTSTPSRTELAGETFTATGGWLVPDAGDQRVGITPPGLFVQDSGPGEGGSMGLEAPATALGLGALFAEDHDFLGWVFEYDASGEDTHAAWASVESGGSWILGGDLQTSTGSFDDAVRGTGHARLSFTSEVRPGVYRGEILESGSDEVFGTPDDDTRNFTLVAGEVAGRWFLVGILDPATPADKSTNFIVVEQ